MVKQEILTLASRESIGGPLMYPGKWVFTWIKTPHMPWVLASIEPLGV